MVLQFVLAVVLSVGITSTAFSVYYWIRFVAGDGLMREFVVVYRQREQIQPVEIDGRVIERRSYSAEAYSHTNLAVLILPPLLINNAIIGIVLGVLAFRYSGHYAGPIYRMSTDIRRVLAGESGVRIHLRRGDEMRELAQRLNALLEALDLAESRARG